MPLRFAARSDSSHDSISGITIPAPRILPGELADGTAATEYQYSFYLDGKRIGGLGFHGTDELTENNGHPARATTFDLGHNWLITSLLELKKMIGNVDSDFSFVRDLAQGLAMACSDRPNSVEHLRYVAITTASALATAGVLIPDQNLVGSHSHVVLAEVYVPASSP